MKRIARVVPAMIGIVFLASACGGGTASEDVVVNVDVPVVEDAAPAPDLGDVGLETVEPECATNEDCLALFPDPGPCKAAVCDATGACALKNRKDYELCDDGDACTVGEVCLEGACGGGVSVGEAECTDFDPCTDDSCDSELGCVHEANTGASCDDGNACTETDACVEGACVGSDYVCDPCDIDADCAPYEDGDLCNGTLRCVEGACQADPETRVVCVPSFDACQENLCVPETGRCQLSAVEDGTICDDGNPCTSGESCAAGACEGGEYVCDQCEIDADCADFDDDNLCNGTMACLDGSCLVDPATVVSCEQPEDPCIVAACNPANGACLTANAPTGTPCDDEDACTGPDRCDAGTCGGATLALDDGDACTTDACDATDGISHTAVDTDDGDACTQDLCDSATGDITHPARADIDDGNPCSQNLCDSATGEITNPPLAAIDDGDACTVDSCDTTTGDISHDDVEIDDDNPCTVDACDSATGAVTHAPVAVDDGDACTVDSCDPTDGSIDHAPVDAGDGNPCTQDLCDSATGEITNPPLAAIDDGDACTQDLCDTDSGAITHPAIDGIDDGDACTQDLCDSVTGDITHPDIEGIDDGDACTQDLCDSATGDITHPDIEGIDDQNACTVDRCNSESGEVSHEPLPEIDDEDPCTDDSCDPATGVVTHDTVDCNDDIACTVDSCDSGTGACLHDTAECACSEDADCDRGNPCETYACDEVYECNYENVADATDCDDEDPCTDGTACLDGACVGGDWICEICTGGADEDGDELVDCEDREDCEFDEACADWCYEDLFEPNDYPEIATPFPLDRTLTGLVSVYGEGTDDYFTFDVCEAGVVHIHATFVDEDGDLDVFLEDEMGVAYASAQSVDDDEDILWVSEVAGPVYVRVQNYTADACTDYTLLVELDESTCVYPEMCGDGVDNDLDGRTDCEDSDCSGSVYLEGACTNPADLPVFAWTDPFVLGFGCVSTEGCGADETCISTCVQNATGLSASCSDCMATLSACALASCEAACASDPTGDPCATCVIENCWPAYASCAGIVQCTLETDCGDEGDNDGDGLSDCDDPDCAEDPVCLDLYSCTNPGEITGPGVYEHSNVDMANDHEGACGANNGKDAVWAFTAAADGWICANTFGTEYDTILYARSVCDLSTSELDCNDDAFFGVLQSQVEFPVITGETYYLIFDGYASREGDYVLNVIDGRCPEALCDDGVDEDGDGLTDCQDDDCDGVDGCEFAMELSCEDAADNDGDGATDCDDDDCDDVLACQPETACEDGQDNDEDGLTDCDDDDCDAAAFCNQACAPVSTVGCGDPVVSTTVGQPSTIDAYAGCGLAWDESGPEHVVAFEVELATDVALILTPESGQDLDVFVLEPYCGSESCVAYGIQLDSGCETDCTDFTIFTAVPGQTYYLVVDGYTGDEGAFELDIDCSITPEDCDDTTDNDGDGATDCDDSDCARDPVCFDGELLCDDGLDNDIGGPDGLTDCDDPDCGVDPACEATCSAPGLIDGPGSYTGSTTGLANRFTPSCQPSDGPEAVWAFTPEASGYYCADTVDAEAELDDTILYAYDACPGGTELACNDDIGYPVYQSEIELQLTGGETTYLVVDAYGNQAGAYTLTVREGNCSGLEEDCGDSLDDDADGLTDCDDDDCDEYTFCLPESAACDDGYDNDGDGDTDCFDDDCLSEAACVDFFSCTSPALLTDLPAEGTSLAGSTTGLGFANEPSCQPGTAPEAVWQYVATVDGALCIDTNGSTFDTVLHVREYDGTGGDPFATCADPTAQVACNDDVAGGGSASEVEVLTTVGNTYFVFVDSYGMLSGDYLLNIRPGACSGDESSCDDGVDNDLDGGTDCADLDCVADPACCTDDAFEDNDTVDHPAPTTEGFYDMVLSDEDWHSFTLLTGETLIVDVLFDSGEIDIDLELWNSGGSATLTPTAQETGDSYERVEYLSLADQDVLVRIYDGGEPICADYVLYVTIEAPSTENDCSNDFDDDLDGLTDCCDDDCALAPVCAVETACGDGADNDCDGDTDCNDFDCVEATICQSEFACDDGADNDGDGATDCDDDDCCADESCRFLGVCVESCAAGPYPTLSCGGAVDGDTATGTNAISYYSCSQWPETGPELVYTYVAPFSGPVTTQLWSAPGNIDLSVLTGSCDAASCLAWGDSYVDFDATAGETYYIVVDGYDGAAGSFTLSLDCTEVVDLPCGAVVAGNTAFGSNTQSSYLGSCEVSGMGGADIVYQFVAPEGFDNTFSVELDDEGYDFLEIFLTDTAGDPNGCLVSGDAGDSIIDQAAQEGDVFYVYVDAPLGFAGPYALSLTCEGIDTCGEDSVSSGDTVSGSTAGEPALWDVYSGCGLDDLLASEAVYEFTAPSTGTFYVGLTSSVTDMTLLVIDSCDPALCLGYDEGAGVLFGAVEGHTYYFVVDGLEGAEGAFEFEVL